MGHLGAFAPVRRAHRAGRARAFLARAGLAALVCAAQAVTLGRSLAAEAAQPQVLLFGECAPAVNHLVLDEDFLARDSAGNQRLVDLGEVTALLHLVSTETRGFNQAWVAQAADTEPDGFAVTDAPCLRLSVVVNGVRRELRWQMVLEPWDDDSRVLHELQSRLGALAKAPP